eukprot:GILI01032089.1.p1 GENE.GILI01032089.1~~GILI01032089.1.p1  ORF type:complete len:148 (-),score=17.01 GILI01032089.1:7-450(-)
MPPKPRAAWATFVFFNFLDPILYTHHRYYRLKVKVDRFLEKRSFWFNAGVGILFGSTAYFLMTPMLPMHVNKSNKEVKQDMEDLLTILQRDGRKEIGATLISDIREDIVCRVHLAVDAMELRRQKAAMAKEKALIEELKAKQRLGKE